ncbi:tetratricopeptide repeat protein [Micromonospora sp. R77]|uniref:AfsR/SARP family transcriptional regulator n=1 Tax=Micromonospora sp. R77 TaxID=2925836 RepID=UPI001F602973|nr:BTAD domain-containing putative transcriptional regulator [Micromonospora sp. R77]MCI4066132.1 tetratricopeptide repeat protein [Micromonospora sp. R77]
MLTLRLLGPMQLHAAGVPVDVGPLRQRMVLAALAIDAGKPLRTEVLIDRVWGQALPQRSRHNLHVYVARIRKVLSEASDLSSHTATLTRRSSGYVLEVDLDAIDVHRFQSMLNRALHNRDPVQERAELLKAALDLWRDRPLADLSGEWFEQVREQWQQKRLVALTSWGAAAVELNTPELALPELLRANAEHPLVETLVAALMRAYAAAGRGAEALWQYAATRKLLAEQLGTEPGPELQALHGELLRGDHLGVSSLAAMSRPRQTEPKGLRIRAADRILDGRTRPAQLPRAVPHLVGRETELATLDKVAVGPTVVVVSGMAGVGKTALVVHWAHRAAREFPDGQLYFDLGGFGPAEVPIPPEVALGDFLQALGVPSLRMPIGLTALAALYRSLLITRRILIVLDNVRTADQVRPLLPATSTSVVLVTSRDRLTGLVAATAAQPLPLGPLTPPAARALLRSRLGHRRGATADGLSDIVAACGGLPLALTIAGARLATRPLLSIPQLAAELLAAGTLDALDGEDPYTDVRTVLSWSYRALTDRPARLFRLLAVQHWQNITVPAAASVAGMSPAQADRALAALARLHLIDESAPGRFLQHDVLHRYATELLHAKETAAERSAARDRLLAHYAGTAVAAARLLEPHREMPPVPTVGPDVYPAVLSDVDTARQWLDTNRAELVNAAREAYATGAYPAAGLIAAALATYLQRHGHWHDQAAVARIALRAAVRLGDPAARALAHRGTARALIRLHRHAEAEVHLRRSLRVARRLGDRLGQARALNGLALVAQHRRRYAEALRLNGESLALFLAAGHLSGAASTLNDIGWQQNLLGRHRRALTSCEQARVWLERLGDIHGQACAWDSLGHIHAQLGSHGRAARCFHEAVRLFRLLGERYLQAQALINSGVNEMARARRQHAVRSWHDALVILEGLGSPEARSVGRLLAASRTHSGPPADGPVDQPYKYEAAAGQHGRQPGHGDGARPTCR